MPVTGDKEEENQGLHVLLVSFLTASGHCGKGAVSLTRGDSYVIGAEMKFSCNW